MNRRGPLIAMAIVCAALPLAGNGSAQEASPAAGTPAVGEPITCVAEPRNVDELLALWFDASGSPMATPAIAAQVAEAEAVPVGERADDATVQAITELTQQWVYCVDVVGQHPRAFSLMTDRLAAQFGPDLTDPAQDSADELRATLEGMVAATPMAEPQIDHIPGLAGPRRTTVLEDGRVAALWSFSGDKILFIYAPAGDGWLIDETVDILEEPEATPEATPAP